MPIAGDKKEMTSRDRLSVTWLAEGNENGNPHKEVALKKNVVRARPPQSDKCGSQLDPVDYCCIFNVEN